MLNETEHNNISRVAIFLAFAFHALVLLTAVIIEFDRSHKSLTDYVAIKIVDPQQREITNNLANVTKIIDDKIHSAKLQNETSFFEADQIEMTDDTTAIVLSESIIIDDRYNSMLDSVLKSNPSIAGMKTIVKERMKDNSESEGLNSSQKIIERARNNLKEKLIAMYKDRYGDISPDKYAGQNRGGGLGVSIPINAIVDLLSEIF